MSVSDMKTLRDIQATGFVVYIFCNFPTDILTHDRKKNPPSNHYLYISPRPADHLHQRVKIVVCGRRDLMPPLFGRLGCDNYFLRAWQTLMHVKDCL